MMGGESIQIILKGKSIEDAGGSMSKLIDMEGIHVNPFFLSEFMNGIEDKETTEANVTAEINSKLSLIQGDFSDGEKKFIKIINLLLDSEINIQFGDNFAFVLSPNELDHNKAIDLYETLFNKQVGKLAHRQARMRYIFRQNYLLCKSGEKKKNGKVIIGKTNQRDVKFNYTNGALAYVIASMPENMVTAVDGKNGGNNGKGGNGKNNGKGVNVKLLEIKKNPQGENVNILRRGNILEISVLINRGDLVKALKGGVYNKKINLDLVLGKLEEANYYISDEDKKKIEIRFYYNGREIMMVNGTHFKGGSRTNKRTNKRSNKRSNKKKSNKKKSQKRKSTRRRKVRKSKRY